MTKYGYKVRKGNSIDIDWSFETVDEAKQSIPRGWGGIIVKYDNEIVADSDWRKGDVPYESEIVCTFRKRG